MTIFLICFLLSSSALSQTTVSGRVVDRQGAPIIGANIILVDTYDGASTDLEGRFTFTTAETGEHTLQATYLGFIDHEQPVTLNGEPITADIRLRENSVELSGVVITAGAFEASDESKREVLKPLDIVTTAGATADIAGALNTLPGTTTVGESGRLFVRGGEGYETRTFIDGMQVLGFYSPSAPNTPGRSRFLPFMFSGASFSTGGYSAEYGQALSSALILQSKFLATQERTDFSLMSVGVDAATTQVWDQASLSAKGQYTNLDPYMGLIEQDIQWIDAPTSWEGSVAYRKQTSESGILKIFGNFNHSAFTMERPQIGQPETFDRLGITNRYGYLNAMLQEDIGRGWNLKGGLSYTDNRDGIKINEQRVDQSEGGLHTKLVARKTLSGNTTLKVGGEFFTRRFLQDYREPENAFFHRRAFTDNLGGLFLESDLYLTPSLLARVGLRSEYAALSRDLHLAPRLSLALKTSKNSQVSAAFGQFRQTPQNEWLMIAPELSPERADHYILNYQINFPQRTLRAELFHKQYHRLVKFEAGAATSPEAFSNDGHGYARGLDLFWRDNKTLRNTDYWVSYSYLDTERDYRDFPRAATPHFAARHNLSVVCKHFVTAIKSQLGFTYTFTSGRPYHDPNQDRFMRNRTPSYQDLSANISFLARQNIIIHLSASNLLGQEQVFGYEYAATPNENGLFPGRAIRPPAKRFLFLGVFITLSPEAVLNQLPNL